MMEADCYSFSIVTATLPLDEMLNERLESDALVPRFVKVLQYDATTLLCEGREKLSGYIGFFLR
uniref:hypothetical protein n=1 Tax=Haloarcula brevis TaxID=3111453 RepID=UPI00300F5582